jgi:hypothetical protein
MIEAWFCRPYNCHLFLILLNCFAKTDLNSFFLEQFSKTENKNTASNTPGNNIFLIVVGLTFEWVLITTSLSTYWLLRSVCNSWRSSIPSSFHSNSHCFPHPYPRSWLWSTRPRRRVRFVQVGVPVVAPVPAPAYLCESTFYPPTP